MGESAIILIGYVLLVTQEGHSPYAMYYNSLVIHHGENDCLDI